MSPLQNSYAFANILILYDNLYDSSFYTQWNCIQDTVRLIDNI